jgi:hypothetical protein
VQNNPPDDSFSSTRSPLLPLARPPARNAVQVSAFCHTFWLHAFNSFILYFRNLVAIIKKVYKILRLTKDIYLMHK